LYQVGQDLLGITALHILLVVKVAEMVIQELHPAQQILVMAAMDKALVVVLLAVLES
jgi:hypothetical protein